MKKRGVFFALTIVIVLYVGLVSCGDSESTYITSITNNTSYDVYVQYPDDSKIFCPPKQETIIEEYLGGSVKKMSCMSPHDFNNNFTEIIIDGGNKILIKDASDDNNWSCNGKEDWSLIMVGSFYSKITTTFVINDEDVKDIEQ